MSKGLAVASALLALFSGLCLSLGVLTPETIKSLGNRLAEYIETEPRWALLRAARGRVLEPSTFLAKVDHCLIAMAVKILTAFIAIILVIVVMLVGAVWAAANLGGGHPISRWIPLGLWAWVCVAILLYDRKAGVEIAQSKNRLIAFFGKTIRVASSTCRIIEPAVWLVGAFVSLFTELIPWLWYGVLKIVHIRDANWILTVLGMALLLVSVVCQIAAIAIGP